MGIITPKQKRALAALLQASSIEEAAKKAGVANSSIRRWIKQDADFSQAYSGLLDDILSDAVYQAKMTISPSLNTLKEIRDDITQNGAVRSQAARTLLEYSLKLTERRDVLDRIIRLEERQGV